MKDVKRFVIALLAVLALFGAGVGLVALGQSFGSLILLLLGLGLILLSLGLAVVLYFVLDASTLF